MSNPVFPIDPIKILPILRHLYAYGEATRRDISACRADPWWTFLCDTRMVLCISSKDECLLATPKLLSLPSDISDVNLIREFCFRYPPYRNRLLAILVQGMVTASLAKMPNLFDRLEGWVIEDVAELTPEINNILDEMEIGKNRLVDLPPDEVQSLLSKRLKESLDFNHWDKVLLGQSAALPELFSAVLEKFGKKSLSIIVDESSPGRIIALLPEFPIVDQTSDLRIAPNPAPWTTARESVFSSLPLFNAEGNPLFDLNKPTEVVWQDALAQQPYYRVVIHLAYAHRLGIGEADQVVLLADDNLTSTTIEVGGNPVGLISDYLPKLVQSLGYHPILDEEIAAQRTANLLQNLMAVHILSWEDGILSLAEDYALSLGMRPRAQTLSRGKGKQERNTILTYLHNEITKQIA